MCVIELFFLFEYFDINSEIIVVESAYDTAEILFNMEHSYSKDVHPRGNVEVMATRSILIPRPPQCPSCYQNTTNDDILAVRK